ncbi:MAG: DUF1232 domain-containing protein [Alistipes sp.]|nr:DUF1232 domain-containing protein [Alistipes sp.]
MREPKNIEKYKKNYSESGLQRKLTKAARWVGAKALYAVLLLYYVLRSPNVSIADKSKIYGALGYFILPTDMILDFIPVVGYTDDMAAIMWAIRTIANNITPEIKAQAKAKLGELIDKYDENKIDEVI